MMHNTTCQARGESYGLIMQLCRSKRTRSMLGTAAEGDVEGHVEGRGGIVTHPRHHQQLKAGQSEAAV